MALKILTGLSSEAITEGSGAGRDVPSGQRNGIPDQVSWQFRTVTSQKVQRHLNVFMNVAIASNVTPHTTWRGLSDRGVNYRRTLQGLVAVDLASGEPLWQYPLQPQLETNLSNARSDGSVFSQGGSMNAPAGDLFQRWNAPLWRNVFCRDNVTGQVAGDSDRLYVVLIWGLLRSQGVHPLLGSFQEPAAQVFAAHSSLRWKKRLAEGSGRAVCVRSLREVRRHPKCGLQACPPFFETVCIPLSSGW